VLPQALADEYKSVVGTAAKAAFRAQWAKNEADRVISSKTHAQCWSVVDSTKGEYLPFGMIVQREGGWCDPTAIEAASRYARKCQMMGKPWTQFNSMTDRVDYLYLSKFFLQDFWKQENKFF